MNGLQARDRDVALREIRAAEAARMVGVLDIAELPQQAQQWVVDGISQPSARALAALAGSVLAAAHNRAVLLATLASECHVNFANLAEARAVHADTVIRTMVTGGDFPRAVFDFSNSYTDHIASRLGRALRRSFGRPR